MALGVPILKHFRIYPRVFKVYGHTFRGDNCYFQLCFRALDKRGYLIIIRDNFNFA